MYRTLSLTVGPGMFKMDQTDYPQKFTLSPD